MEALFHDLISRFGPLGVGLGAGLEGETAVLIGGMIARQGMFSPEAAAIAAWAGSFAADQLFFGLGRLHRNSRYVHRLVQRPAFTRALDLISRHPIHFCFGFRFVYGFRVAGPVAIGVSHVPARLFLLLNCLSAAVWASVFTALGYSFGILAEQYAERLLSPGNLVIALLVAIIGVATIHRWHVRKRSAEARSGSVDNSRGA